MAVGASKVNDGSPSGPLNKQHATVSGINVSTGAQAWLTLLPPGPGGVFRTVLSIAAAEDAFIVTTANDATTFVYDALTGRMQANWTVGDEKLLHVSGRTAVYGSTENPGGTCFDLGTGASTAYDVDACAFSGGSGLASGAFAVAGGGLFLTSSKYLDANHGVLDITSCKARWATCARNGADDTFYPAGAALVKQGRTSTKFVSVDTGKPLGSYWSSRWSIYAMLGATTYLGQNRSAPGQFTLLRLPPLAGGGEPVALWPAPFTAAVTRAVAYPAFGTLLCSESENDGTVIATRSLGDGSVLWQRDVVGEKGAPWMPPVLTGKAPVLVLTTKDTVAANATTLLAVHARSGAPVWPAAVTVPGRWTLNALINVDTTRGPAVLPLGTLDSLEALVL
jgi:hypothetical protein